MLKNTSMIVLLGLTLGQLGCSGGEAADSPADTLTRRQKDSIVATLPVPGAGGVGKALKALEESNARAARHDSLAAGR